VSSKTAAKSYAVEPAGISDLSRQLLQAQEEERRRITRELHDETGQALMVLRFQLEMFAGEAADDNQRARIQESLVLLDRTIDGLRRTIARLSPRVLEELGLVVAIRKQLQLLARHTTVRAHEELPEEIEGLDQDIQVAVYRSVQEALHNVAKHARAQHANVKLTISGGKLALEVDDDGVGFSPRTAADRGFGLKGMRERANALGGSMKIHSQPGKGTRIRIVFHLEEHGSRSGTGKPLRRASAA
jgi:two-component system, NarL family, sensor histidine kinase UhpB